MVQLGITERGMGEVRMPHVHELQIGSRKIAQPELTSRKIAVIEPDTVQVEVTQV